MALKGWTKNDPHRAKLSLSLKGRDPTREAVEKSANIRRGSVQETAMCPHCAKTGGRVAMYRWHFDSCKEKK